jgi:hypothetical protein
MRIRSGRPGLAGTRLRDRDAEQFMNVEIVEISTGKVAAAIPITPPEKNWIPSEQAFFEMAWQSAVEAKDVDPSERENYTFRLTR